MLDSFSLYCTVTVTEITKLISAYSHSNKRLFKLTENLLRMTFPATEQVGEFVKALAKEMDRPEIQNRLGLSHREDS